MNVSFCRLVHTGVSICRSIQKNIAYGFILPSPAVPSLSCSFYLDGLWDRRFMAIHLRYWIYLPNPSTQAGWDTGSIFKQNLTGLNSIFSVSYTGYHTRVNGLNLIFTYRWRENSWIHTFTKIISVMWNTNRCCIVGWYFLNLFKTAHNILV